MIRPKPKTVALEIAIAMVVVGYYYGLISCLNLPKHAPSVSTGELLTKTFEVCAFSAIGLVTNSALGLGPFVLTATIVPFVKRPKRLTRALNLLLIPMLLLLASSIWIAYCMLLKQVSALEFCYIDVLGICLSTAFDAIILCAAFVSLAKRFEQQRALALSLLLLQALFAASLWFTSYMTLRPGC